MLVTLREMMRYAFYASRDEEKTDKNQRKP